VRVSVFALTCDPHPALRLPLSQWERGRLEQYGEPRFFRFNPSPFSEPDAKSQRLSPLQFSEATSTGRSRAHCSNVMRVNSETDNSGRFENKYALSRSAATQVVEYVRSILSPDRGVDRPQQITSLYLETPDLTFYQWHNDRRIDRFKLRIRGYGQPPSGNVWVEIKRKSGELVRKRRAEVALSKLDQVLAGVVPPDCSALREILSVYGDFDARPKVLVRCVRTAFRDHNTYGEVAVTEDREIVCQAASSYDLVGNPQAWRPIALPHESSTIVEFKYVNCPPAWMASLMSELVKDRVRFSKYATAMKQHVAKPEFLLQAV